MTPKPQSIDGVSMAALLSAGYTLISKRRHRHQFDVFEIRLILRKVVCVTGEEAAKRFQYLSVIANVTPDQR